MSQQRKLSGADLELYQKRIGAQMRANVDTQFDVLRAVAAYRSSVEAMAEASDKLSQVVGKLAVSAISSFQTQKECQALLNPSYSLTEYAMENETRQKNLNQALQQLIKFHTQLSQQQQSISTSLLADFERPIQANLDRFRDVAMNWEREFERDLRKLQSDVRQKESDALKMGKKTTVDMNEKLSSMLYELSLKMSEVERFKQDRMVEGLTTDQQQYLLVVHHLQKILKSEVFAMRSVFDLDGVTMRRSASQSGNSGRSGSGNVADESLNNLDGVLQSGAYHDDYEHAPMASQRQSSLNTDKRFLGAKSQHSGTPPRSPLSPIPPPRRGSEDELSFPATSGHRGHNKSQQNQYAGNSIYTTAQPTMSRFYNTFAKISPDTVPVSPSDDDSYLPAMPSNPHRRTAAITSLNNTDIHGLEDIFGLTNSVNPKIITEPANIGSSQKDLRKSIRVAKRQQKHFKDSVAAPITSVYERNAPWRGKEGPSALARQSSLLSDEDEFRSRPTSQLNNNNAAEFALVMYDYIGTEKDDLDVMEGDVLRVISIEDEWIYGLLLKQSDENSGIYIPAEINGQHQMGWVPRSFTAPIV